LTTAFVLSGGASLGAVEVGMLRGLTEAGIRPDMLLGTSVGALNAAYVAGHPGVDGVDGLAALWRSIRRDDVFPLRPITGLLGFLGRRNHLVPAEPLRRLIMSNLTFERLEDSPVPLHVIATEIVSGDDVRLSSGPAATAILASAAIPGVFPPVVIDGVTYIDGGVTDNTPIGDAVQLGADVIYVLPTGHACSLRGAPRGALGVALQAVTVLIGRQLIVDIERYTNVVDLRVVPPLCPLDVLPTDFSRSDELIDRSTASTRDWLSRGEPNEGQRHLLMGHSH
jgi:NTE family protein